MVINKTNILKTRLKVFIIIVSRFKVLKKVVFFLLRRLQVKKKDIRPKERRNGLQIEFGKIVREKRLTLSLSQEGLAEIAGMHFTYVSSVERGERNLSLSNIAKLAKGLECSMKDLMPF